MLVKNLPQWCKITRPGVYILSRVLADPYDHHISRDIQLQIFLARCYYLSLNITLDSITIKACKLLLVPWSEFSDTTYLEFITSKSKCERSRLGLWGWSVAHIPCHLLPVTIGSILHIFYVTVSSTELKYLLNNSAKSLSIKKA